jgi:hypothetical protein
MRYTWGGRGGRGGWASRRPVGGEGRLCCTPCSGARPRRPHLRAEVLCEAGVASPEAVHHRLRQAQRAAAGPHGDCAGRDSHPGAGSKPLPSGWAAKLRLASPWPQPTWPLLNLERRRGGRGEGGVVCGWSSSALQQRMFVGRLVGPPSRAPTPTGSHPNQLTPCSVRGSPLPLTSRLPRTAIVSAPAGVGGGPGSAAANKGWAALRRRAGRHARRRPLRRGAVPTCQWLPPCQAQ